MKQVIIVLLVIILGIIGYNFYRSWQRFHPPNYEYVIPESMDANHPNKPLMMQYHQAVSQLNGYVITQWTTNNIDVRNPKDDDATTLAAVGNYRDKLASVNMLEQQLIAPTITKEVPIEITPDELEIRNELTLQLFKDLAPTNTLRLGEKSALVYEIQRLLIGKGHTIEHDGLFRTETFNALKAFEEKHGLLPDGKLDALSLSYLLM